MGCFSRCNQPFPHYKPYTRCVSTFLRYHLTSLSLKELIQSRKFLFLKLSGHISINPQCGGNIRMTKGVLNDLDIHSSLTHPGRECVSQGVAAKVRKEYGIILTLHQHFVIAVPSNSSNRFVHRSLVIGAAFPVYEDEVSIAIDGYFTLDTHSLLILPLHSESFLHKVQHRNLPDTGTGLRGMHIEIAYSFKDISVQLMNGSSDGGAEKAYDAALARFTAQLIEDLVIRVVDMKLEKVTSRKKKIAAAIYRYQADCDGEWGEIHFDFENKKIKIQRLADWDTTRSHRYAWKVIGVVALKGDKQLPEKKRLIFWAGNIGQKKKRVLLQDGSVIYLPLPR